MSYTIAVRELCAFTAKQGDLDLRFSPVPTAQEGIAGHRLVQSRRSSCYEKEVRLHGEFSNLLVRGRADGYDPVARQLEEIKTYRGDLSLMPENHRYLHWAQLKVYGHLLCEQRDLEELQLALVYFDIGTQNESVIIETHSRTDLRTFFEEQCNRFLTWSEQEVAHRAARDTALAALPFPYPDFRTGQRQLAEAAYKSAGSGRPLLVQAPTGIGKTIGTLFPLLKACSVKKLDKVFFLTAKTPGRQVALEALSRIVRKERAPIRVVELVARDKACEHPDKACHGQSCPLAKGFYDRLPQARQAALEARGKDAVREVALQHSVCPYYLAQDMVRWADVVVADYNYYFDSSALLFALTVENDWQVGLLVDEAHNLVSRARDMYSATINQSHFKLLQSTAPPVLKKEFNRLHRSWNALHKDQSPPYQAYQAIPVKFDSALRRMLSSISEYFIQHPTVQDPALQSLYFAALHFSKLNESFGDHSLFDISKNSEQGNSNAAALCIRNVIPAPHLASRFSKPACTVLFSATLSPRHFYGDMLGLNNPMWMDVDSPFQAHQLKVHIARSISTRFRDRSQSISAIVELMAKQYRERPGNYLAFFSSFEYLQQVFSAVVEHQTDIPVWNQSPGMSETARLEFLDRFRPNGAGIGFAVLGGAFGEGIDLPGNQLIGAFIATLGLPQVNAVNQEMMQRMDAMFGNGYAYTYQYPGLQKVIQAAGRVIRTSEDQGIVHLMDDRFAHREIRELLPRWWNV